MKRSNYFLALVLMLFTSTSWAYGGGSSSSSKACAKPKFTDFVPAENAEVATRFRLLFYGICKHTPGEHQGYRKRAACNHQSVAQKCGQ